MKNIRVSAAADSQASLDETQIVGLFRMKKGICSNAEKGLPTAFVMGFNNQC